MHRLVKWSPFMEMEDMENNFQRMQGFAPAMDVYEKDNSIMVEMPVPGFDEKNVDISIEENVLTIKGSTEKKSEVDDKAYYRKEVQQGSFSQSFAFPVEVEGDKATADYEKGVLTISVPKKEQPKPKKKSIKVNIKE